MDDKKPDLNADDMVAEMKQNCPFALENRARFDTLEPEVEALIELVAIHHEAQKTLSDRIGTLESEIEKIKSASLWDILLAFLQKEWRAVVPIVIGIITIVVMIGLAVYYAPTFDPDEVHVVAPPDTLNR